MKVLVYVEGPSDKTAMETLLRPLIESKRQTGVEIGFYETPDGDRKKSVLEKVPAKAANILLNDAATVVVAMPDLYPKNKDFPHETFEELQAGIIKNFEGHLKTKLGKKQEDDCRKRFHVFCFKHDLEALLLACPQGIQTRLKLKNLKTTWTVPVEDQNHDVPPKKILERLFNDNKQRYKDTVDAPMILRAANYQDVAKSCSQNFKPFVDFLLSL